VGLQNKITRDKVGGAGVGNEPLIFDFLVHKSSVSNFKIITRDFILQALLIWFTNRNASKNNPKPTVIGTTFLETI